MTLTTLTRENEAKKSTMREVAPDTSGWTFRQLKPGQTYQVNVSATNSVGKGPPTVVNITTAGPGDCKWFRILKDTMMGNFIVEVYN